MSIDFRFDPPGRGIFSKKGRPGDLDFGLTTRLSAFSFLYRGEKSLPFNSQPLKTRINLYIDYLRVFLTPNRTCNRPSCIFPLPLSHR
jgi:hypothetical protein